MYGYFCVPASAPLLFHISFADFLWLALSKYDALYVHAGWIHGFMRMTIKKLRNPILYFDIDIYICIYLLSAIWRCCFLWLHSGDSSISVIGAIEPIKPITAITSARVAQITHFLEFYPFHFVDNK